MFRKVILKSYIKFNQHISIQNKVKILSTFTENFLRSFEINDSKNILSKNNDYLKIDLINSELCNKLFNHPIYGPIKDYRRLIKVLRYHGVPSKDIIELLPTKLIHKMDMTDENWKSALNFLKSLGFSKINRLKALSVCPQLIEGDSTSQNLIINVIGMLRAFNIYDHQSHIVLILNPLLLSTSISKIMKMNQYLLKYFTKSDVQKLIIRSPSILTDYWNDTEKKIFYAHNSMGLSGKEISQSSYFSYPLNEIIARHSFLERSGLFKTMKPKTSKYTSVKSQYSNVDSLTKENPSASEIFNHPKEVFVYKTCKMSLEEFECFSQTLDEDIDLIELELESNIQRRNRDSQKELVCTNQYDEDDDDDGDNDSDDYSDDEDNVEQVK